MDSFFYLAGRRNGSIEFRRIGNKTFYEIIRQNRKGQLIEREIGNRMDTFYSIEKYKNGELVSIKNIMNSRMNTVTYYQGQPRDSNQFIQLENNGTKEYFIGGVKMSESEFTIYKNQFEIYKRIIKPRHYYKEYSADSILISEGIYRGYLPCGSYKEYYSSGELKLSGNYNEKGEKNGWWRFYNEQGLIYKDELYDRGNLIKTKLR